MERLLNNGLNESCNNTFASYLKVDNGSMSAIRFWTIVNGSLPHLSYIFCTKQPLGTKLNNVACSVTWDLICIKIQRWKEGTNEIKYHMNIAATAV